MSRFLKLILFLMSMSLLSLMFMGFYFVYELPSVDELESYKAPITTRLLTADGKVLAEVATEKRAYTPINQIPIFVQEAFISAEDKNFRTHNGFDINGIMRAGFRTMLSFIGIGNKEGASTITQQVARNFLLTLNRTFNRKIKEAALTFQIEEKYEKQKILELYLNKIYLGRGTYGIAAASQAYFDKPLDKLNISEAAFLAAIPKSPSRFDPRYNYDRAVERRNYVINRMVEDKKITKEQGSVALNMPLNFTMQAVIKDVNGDYAAEEVRQDMVKLFGDDKYNLDGLFIKTTINSGIQNSAELALREGLEKFDRDLGWRGVLVRTISDVNIANQTNMYMGNVSEETDIDKTVSDPYWLKSLKSYRSLDNAKDWQLSIVIDVEDTKALLGFNNGSTGDMYILGNDWAYPYLNDSKGLVAHPKLSMLTTILQKGDIIYVVKDKNNNYLLRQIPEVQGAIIVLAAKTGRILAMQGGYDFNRSKFNRARQARRQPGSSFKPFVYMTALGAGYTPASVFLDAPIVGEPTDDRPEGWKPKNVDSTFRGLITMREGLEKSINLVSLRIAQALGIGPIERTARDFGVYKSMEYEYTTVLGSKEVTLESMALSYGKIANGGKNIQPVLVDTVQDRDGKIIYKYDNRECLDCVVSWSNQGVPAIIDNREDLNTDKQVIYQITNMMQGAVQRGTGRAVNFEGYNIAAKSGTTNDSKDVWFFAFSPDIVVGAYMGYDKPKTLGQYVFGGGPVARMVAPVLLTSLETFGNSKALFPTPSGITMAWVDSSGKSAKPESQDSFLVAFRKGYELKENNPNTKAKGLATDVKSDVENMANEDEGIY